MTSVLLDTHVVLWVLDDDPRLGTSARQLLEAASDRWVSAASLWEIGTKAELGKLKVPADVPQRIAAAGLSWLNIGPEHAWGVRTVAGLPHRDPFDRLLLSQAVTTSATLLTADEQILEAKLTPDVDRRDARL